MNFGDIILLVLSLSFVIGFFIVMILIIINKKEEPTFNNDKIIIHDIRFSGGMVRGTIINYEEGPDGRRKYTYIPDDVDVRKEIKPQIYIVERGKILIHSTGEWSKGRNIHELFPAKVEYLPKKDIELGLGNFVEKINVENSIIDSLREGFDRIKSQHLHLGQGEFSASTLAQYNKLVEQFINKLNKQEPKTGFQGGVLGA